jgi:hypothetical protein
MAPHETACTYVIGVRPRERDPPRRRDPVALSSRTDGDEPADAIPNRGKHPDRGSIGIVQARQHN